MKLNVDCVRDVLLEFETLPIGNYSEYSFPISIEKYGVENVFYTLLKLSEAEYINAEFIRTMDGRAHTVNLYDMSFSGHQFLETIRDSNIWAKTKRIVGNVGSSGFGLISQVAASILSDLANAYLKNLS